MVVVGGRGGFMYRPTYSTLLFILALTTAHVANIQRLNYGNMVVQEVLFCMIKINYNYNCFSQAMQF